MKKIIKLFVSISTIIMVVFSPFTALTPVVSACYVPSQPDLTITKTNNLGGNNAVVGTSFTWKIRVGNIGNATAIFGKNDVIVKDNMPSSHVGTYGTVSVSASAGVTGVPSKLNCYQNGTDDADLVCRVKNTNGYSITIPAGDYIDFSVTVNPTSVGTITNPKPGSGNICDVDHEHKIDESNESNNACSDSVNIVAAPVCGNGVKEGNEQCDAGCENGIPCIPQYGSSCNYCSDQCQIVTSTGSYCGDGIKNGQEECDDGNTQNGDGCSATCTIEEQECIPEGGSGAVIPGSSCCLGLDPIGTEEPDQSGTCPTVPPVGAFYCTMCGNGICGLGENKCNCPQDCEPEPPCEDIIVISNIDDDVFDIQENPLGKAVLTWIHPSWTTIDSANWIWKTYLIENPTQGETYKFSKSFNIVGTVSSATLKLAADNTYKVWINDVLVGQDLTEFNYTHVSEYNVADKLQSGTNVIKFEVMNMALADSTPETNPAGLLYRLEIARSSCAPEPSCGDGQCNGNETCETCQTDCGICPPTSTTINAYKVVCQTEADLPNWGNGSGPEQITIDTATNFVTNSQGKCSLASGWDFQWGFDGQVSSPLGTDIGPGGTGWHNFDSSTNGATPAQVQITDLQGISTLWFKENLKEGYIPFSAPPTETQSNVSAEMYCHQDILNYDNYDYISGVQLGNTYYCLAFNAPTVSPGCTFGETQPCSTGLLGICSAGTQTCTEGGTWGSCVQTNQPTTENCSNEKDDDCDGLVDRADPNCETPGPYCGDGSCNTSESCSTCSQDCGSCGGGFTLGGGSVQLLIFNEKLEAIFGTSAIVSWSTNIPATSRVVYDTVPHTSGGVAPNYGYAYSTVELPMLTTFHIMAITGLTPNTIYYWRPISHGSGEALGQELVFATVTSETSPPIVETPGTPGTPTEGGTPIEGGTPTEGGTPGETGIPELILPGATEIGIPEITEVGKGQGMLSGFLAAIGGFFNLNNFCQILLLVTLILIILLGLSLYSSKRKEYRIWILSIVILIAIFLYRGICFWKYWWILFLIAVIVAIVAYFLGEKKNKQSKIEFLK